MECLVAWRGYPAGRGVWRHLPRVVLPGRQQLGEGRGDPLPLRDAGVVCGLDALPLDETPLEVEGTSPVIGGGVFLSLSGPVPLQAPS